eukprot:gene19339-biopygen23481
MGFYFHTPGISRAREQDIERQGARYHASESKISRSGSNRSRAREQEIERQGARDRAQGASRASGSNRSRSGSKISRPGSKREPGFGRSQRSGRHPEPGFGRYQRSGRHPARLWALPGVTGMARGAARAARPTRPACRCPHHREPLIRVWCMPFFALATKNEGGTAGTGVGGDDKTGGTADKTMVVNTCCCIHGETHGY